MENGTDNIVSYILLIAGAMGTLLTTIYGIIRANKEQSTKSELDKANQAILAEEKKVEITDKITAVYDRIIDEMNEKFDERDKKIRKLEEDLEIAIKLNRSYEKKIYTLQRAGMTLINAFETAFKTREKRLIEDPERCAECNKADEAVLEILKEYKVLFQNGNGD